MSSPRANLEQIQRWMQSVIMHPGGVAEGVESPEARQHLEVSLAELDQVIRPSRALTSDVRLEIYVDAYYERLLECLREEFIATRHATGDELFDALAFGYLQRYPSQSYTLAQLGDQFAQFLIDSRLHAQAAPAGAPETWNEFVVELATFERLQREVFDAPGTEEMAVLDSDRLARIPPGEWPTVMLVAAPCLRLCAFAHPVHEYWRAVRDEQQPVAPAPRTTYLAINRRAYVLERHELVGEQHALLTALVAGQPLAKAIEAASTMQTDAGAVLAERLGPWFAAWTQGGFFVEAVGSQRS